MATKHKYDLDGNPIVVTKCKHCGKLKGNHKAVTFHCPLKVSYAKAFAGFHPTNTFTPKESK